MGEAGFGRESVVISIEGSTATQVPAGSGPGQGGPAREKYEVSATIGAGGMGEVLLVKDRDLRREIAMKVMRREIALVDEHRLKFVAEAQATSQLEHPGIPPVHDLGLTPDGKPYFTMKLVRGQTLRNVLHSLLVGRREQRQEFTLHRLVTVLERICEALHFAHEKGVLHRDLKPENIMLGDFGEVHVMDWGIARVRGEAVDPEEQVGTEGTDAGLMTVDGCIKGTIPYMSPEQARGQVSRMDRRSDVWSLGCILYEMLTLHMAFEGSGALGKVRAGDFPPVRSRNPRRPVPEDLALLCEQCLSVDPAARPSSARDLGSLLRKWLDGTAEKDRAHEVAEKLVLQGTLGAAANYTRLKEELAQAERVSEEAAERFLPWQKVEECLPMLEAREKVRTTRRAMLQAFSRATTYLEAALLAEERNAAAREALGALWQARLSDAERQGNREEADYALDMMVRYDDANLARVISGEGSLHLTSEPAGAEVVLHRFEDWHGILQEGEGVPLGRTPIGPRELPMGSYLCVLKVAGHRDIRYPVHITRNRSWTGHVRVRADAEIGEDFVYVPGGTFTYGEGGDSETRELPDFAIGRYPVTFGRYAGFLAALEEERGGEAMRFHLPRMSMERLDGGGYGPHPTIRDEVPHRYFEGLHGVDYMLRIPVVLIDAASAEEFCRWESATTGCRVRLPSEEEREKAARGVDGRRFPWGELEHASLARCRDSREWSPQAEPVGSFPRSVSVYGMGDAAGNVWELTASWLDSRRTSRIVRGGSCTNPTSMLGCAVRNWNSPSDRFLNVGFRIARELP